MAPHKAIQKGSNKTIRFPAIYLDMDGTALGKNHEILPETIKALDVYQQCGGRFGIASGRTLEQVSPYLKQISPNLPLVLYNGGLVLSPQTLKPLYMRNLEKASLEKIIELVPSIDGVQTVFVHYANSTIINRLDDKILKYKTNVGIIDTTLCKEDEFSPCVEKKTQNGELPVKVMLYTNWGSAEKVAEEMRLLIGSAAVVLVGSPETIEILPQGVDKSIAIQNIIPSLGLTRDDIVIFGDSGNDTRMVTEFPVSMAMGNCKKETCEAAAFKIGPHYTATIAQVIQRLVMKSQCSAKMPPLENIHEVTIAETAPPKADESNMSMTAKTLKEIFKARYGQACEYVPISPGNKTETLTCKNSTPSKTKRDSFTVIVPDKSWGQMEIEAVLRSPLGPKFGMLCRESKDLHHEGGIGCTAPNYLFSLYIDSNRKIFMNDHSYDMPRDPSTFSLLEFISSKADKYVPGSW